MTCYALYYTGDFGYEPMQLEAVSHDLEILKANTKHKFVGEWLTDRGTLYNHPQRDNSRYVIREVPYVGDTVDLSEKETQIIMELRELRGEFQAVKGEFRELSAETMAAVSYRYRQFMNAFISAFH